MKKQRFLLAAGAAPGVRRCAPVLLLAISACTGNIDASAGGGDPKSPAETSPTDMPTKPGGMGGGFGSSPGASPPPSSTPGAPTVSAATCKATPGAAPLRRLNRFAFDNAVRDLLGDDTRPAQALPPEDAVGAFSNQAEILSTSPLLVQGYVDITDGIAARAVKNKLATLVPCAPATGDETCARKFVETFAKRAWRHPLASEDVEDVMTVYRAVANDGGGFTGGIQATIEAILQAPDFLYLGEVGTAGAASTRRLTSWEVASRLAYILWGSVPDDALLAAAEANQLTDKAQIAAQARRLLADKRARPLIQQFGEEWLGITNVANLGKDTKLVPKWKSSYPALFREETRRFFEDLVFADRRPSALTIFDGRESFMNADLAGLYGVSGVTGSAFARVPLPAQRSGLLTQMSILATYAKSNQTDPIHRGKLIRLNMLCGELPSAPSDIEIKAPELSPNLTTRERFAAHTAQPFCAGCHKLMDPLGLAFENYDAMGVWRDQENGKPVDGSGELVATDVDGKVQNAVELGAQLAKSPQVRACLVRQWFRYTFGRQEAEADACTIAQLTAGFEKNGFDLAGLIVDTLQTENFVARQTGGMP